MKKKRYIYVLVSEVDYEPSDVIGVALSEKRAMEMLPEVVTGDWVNLEKWDVDLNKRHSMATVWERNRFRSEGIFTEQKLKPVNEE